LKQAARHLRLVRSDNEKSARSSALAVVRWSFRHAADPFPEGAGRPKFNQLEIFTPSPTDPVW